jgi:hypothetical protein
MKTGERVGAVGLLALIGFAAWLVEPAWRLAVGIGLFLLASAAYQLERLPRRVAKRVAVELRNGRCEWCHRRRGPLRWNHYHRGFLCLPCRLQSRATLAAEAGAGIDNAEEPGR